MYGIVTQLCLYYSITLDTNLGWFEKLLLLLLSERGKRDIQERNLLCHVGAGHHGDKLVVVYLHGVKVKQRKKTNSS